MLNKLNNMISGLKERDLENNMINENDINEFGFVLVKSEAVLNYYGMAIAGMFIANEEAVKKANVPMIIVDDIFTNLSESTRIFILGHELGHLQHEVQIGQYVRKINDEFEADEYGAKLVGTENAINALNDMKNTLMDSYFLDEEDEPIAEINIRIENLRNKSIVMC